MYLKINIIINVRMMTHTDENEKAKI